MLPYITVECIFEHLLSPLYLQIFGMKKHFTATAFIVDSHNRTLLLWHKRLERWMPPGGHIDDNETPQETARRECKEETGLDVEIFGAPQVDVFEKNPSEGEMLIQPFAMLLENIPESITRGEPAHLHMDFLFHAKPLDENQELQLQEAEGEELRWFSADEIEALNEEKEIFSNVKTYLLNTLKKA